MKKFFLSASALVFAFSLFSFADINMSRIDNQAPSSIDSIKLKPGKKISKNAFKVHVKYNDKSVLAMYGKEWVFYANSLQFQNDAFYMGKLAEDLDVNIGNYPCQLKKDEIMVFHENGTFFNGNTRSPVVKNNIKYYSYNGPVSFKNDELLSGYIKEESVISGMKFRKDQRIYLNPQTGGILSGTISEPFQFGATTIPKWAICTFSLSGPLERITLSGDEFVGAYKYKKQSQVLFYPAGQVKQGQLATDANIKGKVYKAGTKITFDEAGNVTKAE